MAQWWSKPVIVETRKTGDRLVVSSAERATEYMLNEWPTLEDGKAYKAAQKALSDAHDGKLDTEKARAAFIAALQEGDIFIFED
ncbi:MULTISPECIES: DUF982 domain-containing protein [unclassified Rhizobium]|jgi:hypothetical protein|uniref:DUF982 domain-containing protein n=1 Tax=unclassified Rhizobium TaxID=2613769 RepID=UPI0006478346|nr:MULTISPECIES: DUF982 domain-containing protein [unclassified Rhizobium]MBN8950075.1 DUF982 domain-containing protein [Rhizobium tropici]OJY62567.1 MAG: hypothetical protein BGP09_15820 [Rhizobium sp. 60-20]RKD74629.1 uncharacterized protein DUF982 [Rhizobium sp. WW_1]